MEIAITSFGTANPPYRRAQMETAELISECLQLKPAEKRMLRAVYKATGIKFRHSVLSDYCKSVGELEFFPNDPTLNFPTTAERMNIYKNHALNLATQAIEDCFQLSKKENYKSTITHLITVSCTGMYAPGIDIEIVQTLGLASTVKRTAINFMGCYGAFNAIKVANDICKSNPDAKVLIVCLELCTIHFKKEFSITNLFSNAIFADGAAAIIIEKKSADEKCEKCLVIESFYCDLLPQTSQEMAWTIADEGFDIVLSTYVPQAIENGIAEFLNKMLMSQNMTIENIDLYAIHPGGLKILQACEVALGIHPLDNQHSYNVLENFGNMSSATVLFVLKRIWQMATSADKNKIIFSCAFGPGLTLESGLFRIDL